MFEQALATALAQQLDPWTLALVNSTSDWVKGQPLAAKAEQAIQQAVSDALTHVNLVKYNNPDKPMTEILARADVQQALSQPFLDAEEAVAQAIRDAWALGAEAGWKMASKELKTLGLTLGPPPSDSTSQTLSQLLGDAATNAHAAQSRLFEALLGEDPAIEAPQVGKDLQRRAQLSVDAAGQMALNEAKAEAYSAFPDVKKMWVTHFNPGTCAYCRWLHGKVVELDEAFPTMDSKLAVYGGVLDGPPRHPNCRCSLAPVIETQTHVTTPAALQAVALADGADQDAQLPPTISAAALRAIPKAKMGKVLDWLLRKLGGPS